MTLEEIEEAAAIAVQVKKLHVSASRRLAGTHGAIWSDGSHTRRTTRCPHASEF